ncbi:hypothetical protein CRG98_024180 [Punica granatum]|uniref:Uncharacterized protein n=1 Tax=Punica granatum TaxID=22663 RepID=A0A2I0JGL6_PUNGR|nr:hypothetical protein CRG98_024180 [Punica granatum]
MDTFEEGKDCMPSGELGKLTVPSNGYQPWALMASPWHEDLSCFDHADPIRRKWMKRGLCTGVWLSDRDHLFTGESEGCERPFERDGTTRRSRGKKWHSWRARMRRRNFLETR